MSSHEDYKVASGMSSETCSKKRHEVLIQLRVKDNTCALNASKALREAHLDAQRRTRDSTKLLWKLSVAWISNDTEAGVLSGISRKRSVRSNPYWFTEFCNSQCLSHFAAPFIVVRAETSVAESCKNDKVEIHLRKNIGARSLFRRE